MALITCTQREKSSGQQQASVVVVSARES